VARLLGVTRAKPVVEHAKVSVNSSGYMWHRVGLRYVPTPYKAIGISTHSVKIDWPVYLEGTLWKVRGGSLG
jgi:hypothetical protein